VSALVKRFLLELASGEAETKRLKGEERVLRERITTFRASDRCPGTSLHHATYESAVFPRYNILLYSISGRPAEALKRDRAVDLLERTTGRYRCRCCRDSMQRRPDLRGLTRYPMRSPLV
jgi:hypothetical protein